MFLLGYPLPPAESHFRFLTTGNLPKSRLQPLLDQAEYPRISHAVLNEF
jgi:hypothetical protein